MRSSFGKILLWMAGAAVACALMMTATSWVMSQTIRGSDPFSRVLRMEMERLRGAYESGGDAALQAELDQFAKFMPSQRFLVDAQGRDVLTREDHSGLVKRAHTPGSKPRFLAAGEPVIYRSEDGKFAYVVVPRFRPSPWAHVPYLICVLITIAFLSWIFSRSIAKPLAQLRTTVSRFGAGDLSARTASTRRDEFGDVSRAFDEMADRIETLMTAERRLLQDVSHELRTPLSRLGFAIELARKAPDRDAALDRIRKEVDRLNSLVNQLLQVTRAEGDPAAREMEPVPLDELLREVAEDTAWEAELRKVRIVARIGEHATVRGDRELLRRAIENVVRNALRYAPENSTVEIGLESSKDSARIRVRDEGPGVAEENLEQIFQPFFREDSSRNAATGGVGLGLAITYRAIHLHHGQVRARNAAPGLMVEIELPVAA
jgi:two-component system sensor histidine kinase CpxA